MPIDNVPQVYYSSTSSDYLKGGLVPKLHIPLSQELHSRLQREAQRDRRSLTAVVILALEAYLAAREREHATQLKAAQ